MMVHLPIIFIALFTGAVHCCVESGTSSKSTRESLADDREIVRIKSCAYATENGLYMIDDGEGQEKKVYCKTGENENEGWVLYQKRGCFGKPNDYFYKDWEAYKKGFGDPKEDYWGGLAFLNKMTENKPTDSVWKFSDFDGNEGSITIENFWIDNEGNGFALHFSQVKSRLPDLEKDLNEHKDMKFSTKDKDQDKASGYGCANAYKGAFWYNACYSVNANGLYLAGPHEGFTGINYRHFKGFKYSLPTFEMWLKQTE